MTTDLGALAGLRVVELGPHLATPLLGMLLADQGADVAHVRRPGGAPRGWEAVVHRGKRRLDLDLGEWRQRGRLRRLIARADVVLDGFRPGVLERMGFDLDEVRDHANPGLVSVAVPGFAADDPRATLAAWEGAIGALTGLYEIPLRARPVYTPIPIASFTAALYAANGTVAALYARERDGLGQHVEVPLYDATFAAQELEALFTVRPPRAWTTLQWAASPFVGAYHASDGQSLYLHAGLAHHLAQLIRVVRDLGHASEADALDGLSAPTHADPTAVSGVREATRARRVLSRLIRSRPAAEWEERLGEAGLCAVRVRTSAEWLESPPARLSGHVVVLEDPEAGPVSQPGVAVRLSRSPGRALPRAADASDPDALLEAWTAKALPTGTAPDGSAPYRGVRVLDLTQVIAGPTCTRTLAELGAKVTRVENPHQHAAWAGAFHVAFNPGKRSVTLDLATGPGRDAWWRLVDDLAPDVVVHNFRDGVCERLGIGDEALRERLPGVIVSRITAYGRGPWQARPGWEQTAQAVTGMQEAYGGEAGPMLLPIPLSDLGTGLLAAFGTGLALLHRRRTGHAQQVEACLAATATLAQAPLHVLDRPPVRGQHALGSRPLHRFYEARDGWLFLAARDDRVSDLARVPGLGALTGAPPERWDEVLEQALATAAVSVWQARVQSAGLGHRVAVVPRTAARTAFGDPHALHRDLVRFHHHAGVGRVTETGPPLRLSRTPVEHLGPAPPPGADTRATLERLGLDIPSDAPPAEEDVDDPRWSLSGEARWAWRQAKWGAFLGWTRR